jgi:hypothetical protein
MTRSLEVSWTTRLPLIRGRPQYSDEDADFGQTRLFGLVQMVAIVMVMRLPDGMGV